MTDTDTANTRVTLRVAASCRVAADVRCFDLQHPDGAELAPFTAGSHVAVLTPNGSVRKYSLCNDPRERHRYRIAVRRDAGGRGGSVNLVDTVSDGDLVMVSAPSNAFPLIAGASEYVFIAGGIGITPILSMLHALRDAVDVRWTLYYLTRSMESTAFYDELRDGDWSSRVTLHHDHGSAAQSFDLWPVLERPTRAQVYCCGPEGLLESIRDMTGHWPAANIHFESFKSAAAPRYDDRPFHVRLARSGHILEVPVGRSILDVLRTAQVKVASSCESGTCGTCRTRLLGGEAEHRDFVLTREEMHDQIMVCVSRSKSAELVIDL